MCQALAWCQPLLGPRGIQRRRVQSLLGDTVSGLACAGQVGVGAPEGPRLLDVWQARRREGLLDVDFKG